MDLSTRENDPVHYNAAGIRMIRNTIWAHPGDGFRMHWHERMEFLRIRAGEMMVDFGTHQVIFPADSLVIVHPNQLHQGIVTGDMVHYDVMMFDVRSFLNGIPLCQEILNSVYNGDIRFSNITRDPEILACVDRILSENSSKIMNMISEVYRLMAFLYERCLVELPPVAPFDKAIRDVLEYMENNYASRLTTELLSEKFKYAKPYFCRKFKECTGLTPMNYLKILRTEKAYRMLKSGVRDINEIALSCGFSDSNYFTRCFKSHFGFPPTHYRVSIS